MRRKVLHTVATEANARAGRKAKIELRSSSGIILGFGDDRRFRDANCRMYIETVVNELVWALTLAICGFTSTRGFNGTRSVSRYTHGKPLEKWNR